ncbi:similar to Saccharomyces cerevisiae YGR236C SPG1 Protein required for survival at high temperature during stationary phase [Maudiozyma saulgeensis]|uniref:Similar to Saccharomyces cerevisiae YGR236C SPG1 Protein required for survival at high temperature during stationary phase n=1 Tax=Maudiozyma saulgeensis TaxID=1789683 RepID=A0A1X7RA72_9SACH|nr:similar to Saccharomyces cerevisiae YGR236C SPG1 Protein required for survival at high temperature during stationary phase [Kazachstania saulgeensis]
MKIDSNVYSEAQTLAKEPHFKYIMLGVVCGAVVPSMYARRYFSQRAKSSDVSEQENMPKADANDKVTPRRSLIDDELTYELYSSII